MHSLLVFLLLSATVSLVTAREISFLPCGDGAPLALTRVDFFPYPLKPGDIGSVTVTGVLSYPSFS